MGLIINDLSLKSKLLIKTDPTEKRGRHLINKVWKVRKWGERKLRR